MKCEFQYESVPKTVMIFDPWYYLSTKLRKQNGYNSLKRLSKIPKKQRERRNEAYINA